MAQNNSSKKDVAVKEPLPAERFTNLVINEFAASVGTGIQLSENQKRLAQHLFVKINTSLNDLEAKRQKDNKQGIPIIWENVNMQKLALDAVNRIELGLDALVPNHIHPIPYFNGKLKKYDLDLRIGYIGKDYYRRKIALDIPKDIRYELVYFTDRFVVHKKDITRDIESYEFEVTNPFDRGEIKGGFGYIVYDDPTKNRLILVTNNDFLKSEKAAQSDKFWKNHPTEMKYKTLVTRVTDKLQIDPQKIGSAYAAVENDEIGSEINENANQEIIDIEPINGDPENQNPGNQPMSEEEKKAAIEREKREAEEEKQSRMPGF